MKSAKNMEFKNQMFEKSDTHKSSLFVGFNSASHSNLNNYVNHKSSNKTYANNMINQIFETSFSKKRKKWSKILTFFKRNTDMLINLIPNEEQKQKSIFSISKQVLTRPKSHAKFRPYSVNKNSTKNHVTSPLASSNLFGNKPYRPFTENIKFRAKKKSQSHHDEISFIYRRKSQKEEPKQNKSVLELNTFSINSSDNTN